MLLKQRNYAVRNAKGFTIIEVLITMAIFSIGFLGIAKLQFSSLKGNRNAFHISEVLSLAEGSMEQLISAPFSTVIDTNNDGVDGLEANTAETADNSFTTLDGRYIIFWNVADNFPANNTKTIKINIAWGGGSKKMSFSYIKAN